MTKADGYHNALTSSYIYLLPCIRWRGKEVVIESEPRETKFFGGREYILEEGIKGDFALIRAWRADESGNL